MALCDPTDCSTPGFPVLHYLPEFAQARVHRVGDAMQPSHPVAPSPALSLSQHPGLWSLGSAVQVPLEIPCDGRAPNTLPGNGSLGDKGENFK